MADATGRAVASNLSGNDSHGETEGDADCWGDVLSRELRGEGQLNASFVNLVVHAPMPARVRNELINRGYAEMANRLAALLYPDGVPDLAAPNFFCFAHWASAYVGTRMDTWRGRLIRGHLEDGNAVVFHSMARSFLAFERHVLTEEPLAETRRKVDREIPPAPRVNADVDVLVDVRGGGRCASLTNPSTGLPPALVDEIDPLGRMGSAELLQAIRERGFDAYRRARAAPSEADRRRAILEGNAWLVISEQSMVDPALSRAMRSLVRSTTSPLASLGRSRRRQEQRRVGPIRVGFEDAWIELISKTLEWPAPAGTLADAKPLAFRPNGPASVYRWISAEKRSMAPGAPFSFFAMPELEHGGLFWTSLRHRLPVIFAVLDASQSGTWFSDRVLLEHLAWNGFDSAAAKLNDRMSPMSSAAGASATESLRQNDWAVAHRLFKRDRELIFAALFARSLPATYASPHGAALLDLASHNVDSCRAASSTSMADDSLPRLRMSAEFVEAMLMSPLAPGDQSDPSTRQGRTKDEWLHQVERVHAHVRTMVMRSVVAASDQVANPSLFADPMGYEQSIGAGVSFVVPVVETLDRCFGVRWSDAERDSWSRVWVEVTNRQGLAAAMRANTVDDYLGWGAKQVAEFAYADLVHAAHEIRARNDRRSQSGVRLMEKLRKDLEDAIPTALRPVMRVGLAVFGDAEVNRLLLVPESRFAPLGERVAMRFPRLTRVASRRFIRLVIAEIEAAEIRPAWDEVFSPGFDPRTMGPMRSPAVVPFERKQRTSQRLQLAA